MLSRYVLIAAATLATSAQFLCAQNTISVHSGLIQYTSGAVTVGDQPIQKTTTNVLSLKNGDTLATGADGTAEVLMTPGVFVRMVGDSSLRMDSIDLADTRVTILTGTAMVECVELIKTDHVTFFVSSVAGSPSIEVRKPSLFRIDAQPPAVAVLQGEVFAAGVTVTKDRTLALSLPAIRPEKFKVNKQDDLFMFSEARSADSAYASNVASRSLYSAGGTCMGSSWYYMNPVSMYAYLPCNGFNNFFGYPFFGVNYGYMYGGLPYYCPPPVIVCGKGCAGKNHGTTNTVASRPVTVGVVSNGLRVANSLAQDPALAAPKTSGLMKVPAFTSVLSTRPTYLSVSRSNYLANLPQARVDLPSSANFHVAGPTSTGGNRYMAATSLSSSRTASASSSHSFGGHSGPSFSGGGGGSGSHFSGGGGGSSVSHSSGGSFSGGSFSGGGGHSSGGGGGSAASAGGGGGHH